MPLDGKRLPGVRRGVWDPAAQQDRHRSHMRGVGEAEHRAARPGVLDGGGEGSLRRLEVLRDRQRERRQVVHGPVGRLVLDQLAPPERAHRQFAHLHARPAADRALHRVDGEHRALAGGLPALGRLAETGEAVGRSEQIGACTRRP